MALKIGCCQPGPQAPRILHAQELTWSFDLTSFFATRFSDAI
jgi:hypothetical protein